jgi:hypothetical protein
MLFRETALRKYRRGMFVSSLEYTLRISRDPMVERAVLGERREKREERREKRA